MDETKIYIGYHATDQINAEEIKNKNFRISKNEQHWLGFGIYFFLDRDLAKWWATNPTKKFGCEIKNPVIIQSKIKVHKSQVCDLRDLKTYNIVMKLYNNFIDQVQLGKLDPIFVTSLSSENSATKAETKSRDVIECLFFNWLVQNYDIKIIIACFNKSGRASYLTKYPKDCSHKLRVIFPETQVCVPDPGVIIHNTMEGVSYV